LRHPQEFVAVGRGAATAELRLSERVLVIDAMIRRAEIIEDSQASSQCQFSDH
jgi:hypothetical protein